MPASTRPSSKVTQSSMIVLVFNQRRVIVLRPISYQAAVNLARKYFSEITLQSNIKFLCDELDICQGQLAEIPEELWREVINNINSLTVDVSPKDVIIRDTSPCPGVYPSGFLPHQPNQKIRITIDNHENGVKTFRCLPSTLVEVLHDLYDPGLGKRQHYLSYEGERLHPNRPLSDYDIEDGTVIDAIRHQVGGKPVIYLFSPENIEASVSLSLVPEWRISALYPVVPVKTAVNEHGQTVVWRVKTKVNGDLTELNTGLDVSYLFWEAHTEGVASTVLSPPASPTFDENAFESANPEYFNPTAPNILASNSVVLPIEKITLYLDKALNSLGLHTEARTSFITYWLPSLLKHKHIALRFLPQTAYERAAPLDVFPKPDIVTRIFMLFKGIEDVELPFWKDAIESASQDVQRWIPIVGVDVGRVNDSSLFRVLEWGGMEVS